MAICQHIKWLASLKLRGSRVGRDIIHGTEGCDEEAETSGVDCPI
jgi:hypothetical protein